MLVPRGIEGDDQEVVVQRDVQQLEEHGEHVLVLVQHSQGEGPVPRALTGHDPLHPRSRRFSRRTVAFGHQDVDRVLQQPLRLGHPVQQQVQLGVRRRAGQAVQDPVQQAEEARGEQPTALVLREPRQAGAGGIPDDDRRGAAASDAGHRDPHPVPAVAVLAAAPVAQVPGLHRGPALPLVQHRQADVDLGRAARDPVVGDGQRLAEAPDVVEAESGIQERQPDRGTDGVLARRSARHRHAHDGVAQRGAAVHGPHLPQGRGCVTGHAYR